MGRRVFLHKVRTAIRHPGLIPGWVRWRINRRLVTPVVMDGVLHHRYRGQLYADSLNHGNACAFIAEKALVWCQGKGIDVGASTWPLAGAAPIRDEPHQNAYKLDAFGDGSLDYVFSSHCLEHLGRWKEALALWIRKLRPGGILFLYLPHESMGMWRRFGPWVGLGHQWIPTAREVLPFLRDLGMEIVEFEPNRDAHWGFHICARRPDVPAQRPGIEPAELRARA